MSLFLFLLVSGLRLLLAALPGLFCLPFYILDKLRNLNKTTTANLFLIFDTVKFCLPRVSVEMDLCKNKMTKNIRLTGFWWENAHIFVEIRKHVKSVYTMTAIQWK